MIEQCNAQIEVSGKCHPQQVGDLQQGGWLADRIKGDDHRQNQHPEKEQPEEREKVPLAVEKKDWPEEIHHELRRIQPQRPAPLRGGGEIDQIS